MSSTSTSSGAKSPDPPDSRPPIGTTIEAFGELRVITGYDGVTGYPTFTQRPQASDEDGFKLGTSAKEKVRTLRTDAHELVTRASREPAGPERDWALSQARRYLSRSHALAGTTRVRAGRPSGRHEARPAIARRASSSSRTSSADPGSDSSDESEPPASGRFCQACGADISHRRADAKTCDQNCRQDKSRGKVAPPRTIIKSDRPLEDEIAAKAAERHLAFAVDVPTRVRDDLTRELEELYDKLRTRRAGQPVHGPGRAGNVVVLHAPLLPRPWATTQGAYRRRRREAVAA